MTAVLSQNNSESMRKANQLSTIIYTIVLKNNFYVIIIAVPSKAFLYEHIHIGLNPHLYAMDCDAILDEAVP